MKMGDFSLSGTNIVILAKNHNPSIVTKEWLAQKEIIEEEVVNFTHTPLFSLVETANFNLIVDPNRLQISVKETIPENIENLPKIIKTYITKLPETPYTAMGVNYSYRITMGGRSLRDIFSFDDKILRKTFSNDYRLGITVHFTFSDFVVSVNLQPSNEELTADLNFHFISKNPEEIKRRVEVYSELKNKAEEILEGLFDV
jgi:hypothetical protein